MCDGLLSREPPARESGQVKFDKRTDRFDESATPALSALAAGHTGGATATALPDAEVLISNLLPLVQAPTRIYRAATSCRTTDDAHERFVRVDEGRASDYLLREGNVYSFRDLSESPVAALCDGPAESFDAAEWSDAKSTALHGWYANLLRRTFLHQYKGDLRWQPDKRIFYFRAPSEPIGNRFVRGARSGTQKQVVKVERRTAETGEELISWVRHHAFHPKFVRLRDHWYLAVEPDYYFTYDGVRETFKAPDLAAGIKGRFDKNAAVLGNFRVWERLLTEPPSLLGSEAPLLGFGPAESVTVDRRLDDAQWEGKLRQGAGPIDGQEVLAA